jgi:hypothetical protein
MRLAHCGPEHIPRLGRPGGEHERVQRAVLGTDRRKRLLLFANDWEADFRSPTRRSPAASRITDAPETGLLLEQETDRRTEDGGGGYLLLNEFR